MTTEHDQAEADLEAQPGGWKRAYQCLAYHHAAVLTLWLGEERAREILATASWDASIYERGSGS